MLFAYRDQLKTADAWMKLITTLKDLVHTNLATRTASLHIQQGNDKHNYLSLSAAIYRICFGSRTLHSSGNAIIRWHYRWSNQLHYTSQLEWNVGYTPLKVDSAKSVFIIFGMINPFILNKYDCGVILFLITLSSNFPWSTILVNGLCYSSSCVGVFKREGVCGPFEFRSKNEHSKAT